MASTLRALAESGASAGFARPALGVGETALGEASEARFRRGAGSDGAELRELFPVAPRLFLPPDFEPRARAGAPRRRALCAAVGDRAELGERLVASACGREELGERQAEAHRGVGVRRNLREGGPQLRFDGAERESVPGIARQDLAEPVVTSSISSRGRGVAGAEALVHPDQVARIGCLGVRPDCDEPNSRGSRAVT